MTGRDALPRRLACALLLGLLLFGAPAPSAAQNAAQSFADLGIDSDTPVAIEADVLEVFDEERRAVFSGNVVLRQGEVEMRCARLDVHYVPAEGSQRGEVRRLEATGQVLILSADQEATGDWAVFEVGPRIITMGDDIVLTQGGNVLRGTKLVVDLANGTSRLEARRAETRGGRVQGVFVPGSNRQEGAGGGN